MDHPRVLVVDDDADVGEFLRDALSTWSYDVTHVKSGREAVDLISRQIFDAALVDIWMPEMDGLQVLEEMKRHDPALEVVMMTGNPMVETAVQALKSGAYDYLIKPLNLDELQHLMQQVLEKRFLSREVHSLRNRLAEHLAVKDLVGNSPGMTRVREVIAKVSPALQAKLLRVLQEKEIRPVGSTKTHSVSVRMIAATNKNLEAVVQSGGFRQDLFYRLNVVRIVVPPLRERKADIPALLTYFLRRFNERFRRDVKGVAPDAMAALTAYDFPGNVRELENLLERAFALGARDEIERASLPDLTIKSEAPAAAAVVDTLPTLDQAERDLIARALERFRNDK